MSSPVTAEGFTVVRVKRKKDDDPDKGLRVDLKRVSLTIFFLDFNFHFYSFLISIFKFSAKNRREIFVRRNSRFKRRKTRDRACNSDSQKKKSGFAGRIVRIQRKSVSSFFLNILFELYKF